MFPEKLPGATGISLMTWESLSGYPLDRSSPLEYHLLFTCAGNSCKEVITHVIDNIVSLERDQPAHREPAPHHWRHSRLFLWQWSGQHHLYCQCRDSSDRHHADCIGLARHILKIRWASRRPGVDRLHLYVLLLPYGGGLGNHRHLHVADP